LYLSSGSLVLSSRRVVSRLVLLWFDYHDVLLHFLCKMVRVLTFDSITFCTDGAYQSDFDAHAYTEAEINAEEWPTEGGVEGDEAWGYHGESGRFFASASIA
jgi:hypothetical protein